jgi:membrane-bound serine protease (ClpP class)
MQILLDPNVAYVILVGGFLLAILALFAPGTGVLEVGAVFALLIAGYEVYNLPINWWALAILLIGVFPFLIAVRRSRRLIYLAVSLVALVLGSVFLFRTPTGGAAVNPFIAIIASALTAGFLWLAASKALQAMAMRPSQDMSRIIGAVGETKTALDPEGSVYVKGENWSARSTAVIPPNTRVRVLRREGLVLFVEPEAQQISAPTPQA